LSADIALSQEDAATRQLQTRQQLKEYLDQAQELLTYSSEVARSLTVCQQTDPLLDEMRSQFAELSDAVNLAEGAHADAKRRLKLKRRSPEEKKSDQRHEEKLQKELLAARRAKRDFVAKAQEVLSTGFFPRFAELLYEVELDCVREFRLPTDR
jgi:hypothetical protein